jgi:hypothetical protein
VGHLERRLRKLEGWAEASEASLLKLEEARQQREIQEVVQRLSTEDLRVLDEVLVATIERGEDLCEVVDRLGAQAVVDRFERAWADYRRETRDERSTQES